VAVQPLQGWVCIYLHPSISSTVIQIEIPSGFDGDMLASGSKATLFFLMKGLLVSPVSHNPLSFEFRRRFNARSSLKKKFKVFDTPVKWCVIASFSLLLSSCPTNGPAKNNF
jgi:hypothetical protein